MLSLLSESTPSAYAGLVGQATSSKVNRILGFYVPLPDAEERKIWESMKSRKQSLTTEEINIPDDERVEDAGLTESI